jgi:hypothetical protein
MSRPPPVRYPDPAYNGSYDRDPFVTPAQSTQSHGRYDDSDMDHSQYDRRDTFQSDHPDQHNDPRYYQPPYDPYGMPFRLHPPVLL